jgi:hypothetical protein
MSENRLALFGFSLQNLAMIGGGFTTVRLISEGWQSSYVIVVLLYVALLVLSIILMRKDPSVRSVGILNYRPKASRIWWVGHFLFFIGSYVGIGTLIDSVKYEQVTQFRTIVLSASALSTAVGLFLLFKGGHHRLGSQAQHK